MSAKKYWFKKWYPSSWQGWLVLGVYIWFVVWDFQRIDSASHSVGDTLLNFIPDTIILTAILIFIFNRHLKKDR